MLPHFFKDTTDRNRTSPFAFTGNKFEFRMLGSTVSVSGPNIVLNTIVAEVLDQFADELEKATDFNTALNALIKRTIVNHKRIIFNGDGYSEEWTKEAERRGLLNLRTTPDALPYFVSEKSIKLFTKHNIFTEAELNSRYEILLENYCKTLNIEALTMIEMARRSILPAIINYTKNITDTLTAKQSIGIDISKCKEKEVVEELSYITSMIIENTEKLENALIGVKDIEGIQNEANYYKDTVIAAMNELRAVADRAEVIVGDEYWPYPRYGELLFSIL